MLHELKHSALSAMRHTGLTRFVARSRWRRKRLLVLCYHGVSLGDEHEWDPELYISPETLARRFEMMDRAGCTVLPLDDAVRHLFAGTLPPLAVTITFDDGYYDFMARAFPLLQAHGWPATVYVTTQACERRRPVAPLLASYLLWKNRERLLDARGIAGLDRVYRLASPGERRRAVADMRQRIAADAMTPESQEQFACEVLARLGLNYRQIAGESVLRPMTPAHLAEMSRRGVAIELHTHRHRAPEDPDEFLEEVRVNRTTVRAMTGRTPRHFCYPGGVHHATHLPTLEGEGVESATTCVPGLASHSSHRLLLPRFVDNEIGTDVRFEAWLSGVASWLPRRARTSDDVH